jgi:hypothetical protein
MSPEGPRLSAATRWLLVVQALGLLAILAIACWLEPDPRGHGTHGQLGLPPCPYWAATGRKCPACGLTTAVAWAVRGRVDRAWSAQPAGLLLVAVWLGMVPWLVATAISGRPRWGARSIEGPITVWTLVAAGAAVLAWAVRL